MTWKVSSIAVTAGCVLLLPVLCLATGQVKVHSEIVDQIVDDGKSQVSDNGLGKHIIWHTLDEGYKVAKQNNTPIMFIIHKSWCGACKDMRDMFSKSKRIAELSKHFVMVNAYDNDEPEDDHYAPDGGYVPRTLFFDHDGSLIVDVINERGNPEYKYFFFDEVAIVAAMEKVLNTLYPSENGLHSTHFHDADEEDPKLEL